MKKNLAFLTGIVFLLTILVAIGCGDSTKKNNSTEEENVSEEVAPASAAALLDTTTVEVYLKEIMIGGKMHLLMSDSRKPDFEVIDGLITIVYPGYTVKFMKGKQSKIDSVSNVIVLGKAVSITEAEIVTDDVEYYRIEIDSTTLSDTIAKYEIRFYIKDDPTEYIVDPYLKVPPSAGNGG